MQAINMKCNNQYPVKKSVIFFFGLFTFIAGQAQEKYTVSGKFDGLPKEAKIYLQYRVDRDFINDSTITKNGIFNFEGAIARPLKATLVVRPMDGNEGFAAGTKDQSGLKWPDRKSTRLNSSHQIISYAVFCLKKKTTTDPSRDVRTHTQKVASS